MGIIIWGLGEKFRNNQSIIDLDEVDYFIDSNFRDHEGTALGKVVLDPSSVRIKEDDIVIVASSRFFGEISNKLVFYYGVKPDHILSLDFYLRKRKGISEAEFINRYLKDEVIKFYLDCCCDRSTEYKYDFINRFFKCNEWVPVERGTDIEGYVNILGAVYEYSESIRDICVYVATHKEFPEITVPGYTTVFGGAANQTQHLYAGDDSGDHISGLNAVINECTVLYWIWKNTRNEIVGLNHYRRYFESKINCGFAIQRWEIDLLLKNYDIIVGEPTCSPYGTVMDQLKETVCEEAINESYYVLEAYFTNMGHRELNCLHRVVEGHFIFPCQMFITSRELLNEYCLWLFPILFELIDKVDINPEWDAYSKRVIGFWAERMLTVWLLLTGYKTVSLKILLTNTDPSFGKERLN